jgi:hypothetical protein
MTASQYVIVKVPLFSGLAAEGLTATSDNSPTSSHVPRRAFLAAETFPPLLSPPAMCRQDTIHADHAAAAQRRAHRPTSDERNNGTAASMAAPLDC